MAEVSTNVSSESTPQSSIYLSWLTIDKYYARIEEVPANDFCAYSPPRGMHKNFICSSIATDKNRNNTLIKSDYRCGMCNDKRGIMLDVLAFKQANLSAEEKGDPCETKVNIAPLVLSEEEPSPKNYILETEAKMSRGRGRPRKYPLSMPEEDKPKRGRGRPRKYPLSILGGDKPKSSIKSCRTGVKPIKSAWISATKILQERLAPPYAMKCAYSPDAGRYGGLFCGNEILTTNEDYFWNYRCNKCKNNKSTNGVNILFKILYSYFREGVKQRPLENSFDDESSLPLPNDESSLPLPNDESSLPLPNDESSLPLPNDESSLPLPNDESSLPLPNDESSLPLPNDESSLPLFNDKDEICITCNRDLNYLLGHTGWFLWEDDNKVFLVKMEADGLIIYGRFAANHGMHSKITLEDLQHLEDPSIYLGSKTLVDMKLGKPSYVLDILKKESSST